MGSGWYIRWRDGVLSKVIKYAPALTVWKDPELCLLNPHHKDADTWVHTLQTVAVRTAGFDEVPPPPAHPMYLDLFSDRYYNQWDYEHPKRFTRGQQSTHSSHGYGCYCENKGCLAPLGFGCKANEPCHNCGAVLYVFSSGTKAHERSAAARAAPQSLTLADWRPDPTPEAASGPTTRAAKRRAEENDEFNSWGGGTDDESVADSTISAYNNWEEYGHVAPLDDLSMEVCSLGVSTRRDNSDGGPKEKREQTSQPLTSHSVMGSRQATEEAIREAKTLTDIYHTAITTQTGHPLLVATYEAIDAAFAKECPEEVARCPMTISQALVALHDLQEAALEAGGGVPNEEMHPHQNVPMFPVGWWTQHGGGRPAYVVDASNDERRVYVPSKPDDLPADGHAAEAITYLPAPLPWEHTHTQPWRVYALHTSAVAMAALDAIIAAFSRPSMYKIQVGDILPKYLLHGDSPLPSHATACSPYTSGGDDRPSCPSAAAVLTAEQVKERMDGVFDVIEELRKGVLRVRSAYFPAGSAVATMHNQQLPTGAAQAASSSSSSLMTPQRLADEAYDLCARLQSQCAITAEAGASRKVRGTCSKAQRTEVQAEESTSDGVGAGATQPKAQPPRDRPVLGPHVDKKDKHGRSTFANDGRTGLTAIFAHSHSNTAGGTTVLTHGLEADAEKYPRTDRHAEEALAWAAAHASDAVETQARRVLVNPYQGGGSYMVSYLGDGGGWHAGEATSSKRRAAPLYTGEAMVAASNAERKAAETYGSKAFPIWSEAERKHRQGDLLQGGASLTDMGVTAASTITLQVKADAATVKSMSERPPPESEPNGLTVVLSDTIAAKVGWEKRIHIKCDLGATSGQELQQRLADALQLSAEQVELISDCRLKYTIQDQQKEAKELPVVERLDLSDHDVECVIAYVHRANARADLLGLLLRMLRWAGEREAFNALLVECAGAFAPASLPFIDRRFTQDVQRIESAFVAVEALVAAAPARDRRSMRDRAFFIFVLIGCRLNFLTLLLFADRVKREPDLLINPTRTLSGDKRPRLVAALADIYRERKAQTGVVNHRFWRIQRISTHLTREEDDPPPLPLVPQLWKRVNCFIKSLTSVEAATATSLLKLQFEDWTAAVIPHVQLLGPVWATVTGRERQFYRAVWVRATEEARAPTAPVTVTANNNVKIGAGGANGMHWEVGRALGKNGRQLTISAADAARIVKAQTSDADTRLKEVNAAVQWLAQDVSKERPELERHQSTFSRVLLKDYPAVVQSVRNAGPPSATHAENHHCDGTKLLMGWEERYLRVGKLMYEGRLELGELEAPDELLFDAGWSDVTAL